MHKIQQILNAFTSDIGPMATVGSNIEIGRPYRVDQEELVWMNIRQGAAEKLDGNWQVSDWQLLVHTELTAKENPPYTAGYIVNQMYNELVVAIDPNPNVTPPLGLSFVLSIEEIAATPMSDEYSTVEVSGLTVTWLVMFRRATNNPSA